MLLAIIDWTPLEALLFAFGLVASLRWADMLGAFIDDRVSAIYEWLFPRRKNED